VERLRESGTITSYQQQLAKEFEKYKKKWAGEETTHVDEEWNQMKEGIVETAEHTVGYQPKPDKRRWFHEG
jgi:uncharacterized protein YukE